jgi:hypothetical protein
LRFRDPGRRELDARVDLTEGEARPSAAARIRSGVALAPCGAEQIPTSAKSFRDNLLLGSPAPQFSPGRAA